MEFFINYINNIINITEIINVIQFAYYDNLITESEKKIEILENEYQSFKIKVNPHNIRDKYSPDSRISIIEKDINMYNLMILRSRNIKLKAFNKL